MIESFIFDFLSNSFLLLLSHTRNRKFQNLDVCKNSANQKEIKDLHQDLDFYINHHNLRLLLSTKNPKLFSIRPDPFPDQTKPLSRSQGE